MTNPTGTNELSLSQRQAILQGQIGVYVGRGYRVVSQTETTAQLVKPKVFSCFWAIVWFLLAVFPFIVYIILYAAKRDNQIYIQVQPDGRVTYRS